ncbi:hypothetical protein K501DRAFT_329482 [Backusella circina FSU 941]|nr:hypothetical protein K501DRAFT_329482 [Backusella circina FSU 941]
MAEKKKSTVSPNGGELIRRKQGYLLNGPEFQLVHQSKKDILKLILFGLMFLILPESLLSRFLKRYIVERSHMIFILLSDYPYHTKEANPRSQRLVEFFSFLVFKPKNTIVFKKRIFLVIVHTVFPPKSDKHKTKQKSLVSEVQLL